MRLWIRDLILTFSGDGGSLTLAPNGNGQMLRVRFKVKKTITGSAPNAGTLEIWNLSKESREALRKELDSARLEAGHVEAGNRGIILTGQIRDVAHARENADIVTTVEVGDGEKGYRQGTIRRTFPAGTKPAEMIDAILEQMPEVDRGVIHEAVQDLPAYPRAVVMCDFCTRELDKIGRTHGLHWSVQDGALEVVPGDRFIDEVTVISQRTGMIGVPSVTDKGIEVRTLLNPQIKVGRVIEVRSETLDMNDEQGRFRVSGVGFSGDTHADDWFADITADRIQGDRVVRD